ncbi:MAG: [NiFe]-hydrogenase assembly chaperone HybE [Pseudomonadota bacterium]
MSAQPSVGASAAPRSADELRLERTFEGILATRMAGLEFLNTRLRVAALGFRDWRGLRLGALVTPWCINLMLMDGAAEALPPVRQGDAHPWAFPSGVYGFMAHTEADVGTYHQCSLFSPVTEFASQEDAEQAAHAALEALLQAPQPAPVAGPARLSRRGLLTGG